MALNQNVLFAYDYVTLHETNCRKDLHCIIVELVELSKSDVLFYPWIFGLPSRQSAAGSLLLGRIVNANVACGVWRVACGVWSVVPH